MKFSDDALYSVSGYWLSLRMVEKYTFTQFCTRYLLAMSLPHLLFLYGVSM